MASEALAAGFWPRVPASPPDPRSGFESGGSLDVSPPGGSLAGLADAATRDGGLAGLDDDELIGVMRAWQRLESWCASGMLTANAELARRRPADRTPPGRAGAFPAALSEFTGDEVAAALTLTARTAALHLDLALDLATRLPGTARALRNGLIDRAKARLIADATGVLTADQARQVEAQILAAAAGQTTGQLRASVARAVLAVDPAAATRRREEAQQDPRVRRWQEDAGTAALAGFGLPPADVLEADQRLTARALALREAGLAGSLEELRVRAYLDALLGQDSTPASPGPSIDAGRPSAASTTPAEPDAQGAAPGPAEPRPAEPEAQGAAPVPAGPRPGAPAAERPLAARLTLTVPLATCLGLGSEPGTVAGFGPVDPALARALAARAAAHPASRFCLTVTGPSGQAVGHGCFPGHPPDLTRPGPGGFTVTITPLANSPCAHHQQEPGYQPSRRLRHLVQARLVTCTAPGCSQPAARCDLDHTTPHEHGGRTCECNLAPPTVR